MSEMSEMRDHALSFAAVAEAYDRARPSYPAEAVAWLAGSRRANVLELGAGTGKLTELLVAAGHDVIATDPLPEMLQHLRTRVPGARVAVASAERIPVASRSADVVVCAQSFHWFDHDVALPEIARVLRPGGVLALVWNARDEAIPWVRKLGAIIGSADNQTDLAEPAEASEHFGALDHQEFRFWQSLRREELFDLVRSRSYVALLGDSEREDLLARVGALYDDYGRGPDGMQLPYLTRCYRTVVRHQAVAPNPYAADLGEATQSLGRIPAQAAPPDDPGTLLIDFK
jgi:SAM-dependent methyltransferase